MDRGNDKSLNDPVFAIQSSVGGDNRLRVLNSIRGVEMAVKAITDHRRYRQHTTINLYICADPLWVPVPELSNDAILLASKPEIDRQFQLIKDQYEKG